MPEKKTVCGTICESKKRKNLIEWHPRKTKTKKYKSAAVLISVYLIWTMYYGTRMYGYYQCLHGPQLASTMSRSGSTTMPKGGSSTGGGNSWKHGMRRGRQKDDSIIGGGHKEREVEITYTRGGTARAEKNDEHASRGKSVAQVGVHWIRQA